MIKWCLKALVTCKTCNSKGHTIDTCPRKRKAHVEDKALDPPNMKHTKVSLEVDLVAPTVKASKDFVYSKPRKDIEHADEKHSDFPSTCKGKGTNPLPRDKLKGIAEEQAGLTTKHKLSRSQKQRLRRKKKKQKARSADSDSRSDSAQSSSSCHLKLSSLRGLL